MLSIKKRVWQVVRFSMVRRDMYWKSYRNNASLVEVADDGGDGRRGLSKENKVVEEIRAKRTSPSKRIRRSE